MRVALACLAVALLLIVYFWCPIVEGVDYWDKLPNSADDIPLVLAGVAFGLGVLVCLCVLAAPPSIQRTAGRASQAMGFAFAVFAPDPGPPASYALLRI